MKWLRKLFGICNHSWEIYETCNIKFCGVVKGKMYILKCKHCGKLHNHEVHVGY